MGIGEVVAICSDVLWILGCCSAETALCERTVNGGTCRHVDSREDRSGVALVCGGGATLGVLPNEVFADRYPLVNLILARIVQRKVLVERVAHDALIVVVSEREAVGEGIGTGVDGYVVTLVEGGAEHLVHPVGTGCCNPRILLNVPAVGQWESGVCERALTHLNLLLSVERFGQVSGVTHTHHTIVRHSCSTLLCLLGGDEHYAACSRLRTVDSSRSGILQYYDRLNVVERSNRCTRHSVDYPQHVVAVLRALTTDYDVRSGCRVATIGSHRNACQLTLQHTLGRGDWTHCKLVDIAHNANGCREVFLLGSGTVADSHHFVEHLAVFFENNSDVAIVRSYLYVLGCIAYIRYLKRASRHHLKRKITIYICYCGSLIANQFYRGSDDRLSVLILHNTMYGNATAQRLLNLSGIG